MGRCTRVDTASVRLSQKIGDGRESVPEIPEMSKNVPERGMKWGSGGGCWKGDLREKERVPGRLGLGVLLGH